MKHSERLIASIPLAALLLWAGSAHSADVVVKNLSSMRVLSDSDLAQVRPYSNPLPPPDTSSVKAETDSMPVGAPGATPGSEVVENPDELGRAFELEERAFGSFGIPYTSTRVELGGSNQTSAVGASYLSSTYPYRTAGKLTFSLDIALPASSEEASS